MRFDQRKVDSFDDSYQSDWEGEAHGQRGAFLRAFPESSVGSITLEQYVIGKHSRDTFCYWVEVGTKKWALVGGATAAKFGVYYGKTKTENEQRYRYTRKFARELPMQGHERTVFNRIKGELVELLDAGKQLNFARIDVNPLSQMLKAKILSLYYPQKFLNICDSGVLRDIAFALEIETDSPSEIQHLLLASKNADKKIAKWSDLKFMAFLFRSVLKVEPGNVTPLVSSLKKPKPRKVDFEKLQARWRELGKKSEAFALQFEKDRLNSLGLSRLTSKIGDRTSHPSYGYDFDSWTNAQVARYIEVKTFTRGYFFLSLNERKTSESSKHRTEYYFYLVEYGAADEPTDVRVVKASHLYKKASFEPQVFLVTPK